MPKISPYLMGLVLVILLFHMAGLISDTPNGELIKFAINPEHWKDFDLTNYGLAALSLAGISGMIIGSISPQRSQWIIVVAFTAFLFTLGWDIMILFNGLKLINEWFALGIIAPLMIAYIMAVMNFWRGLE